MKSLEIDDIKENPCQMILDQETNSSMHKPHVDLGTNKWSDSGIVSGTAEKKDSNLREILKDDLKSYLRNKLIQK